MTFFSLITYSEENIVSKLNYFLFDIRFLTKKSDILIVVQKKLVMSFRLKFQKYNTYWTSVNAWVNQKQTNMM